jgi:hypothetical protein
MRSCLLDSAQPLPEEIGPTEGQTARYWPDADAQAGGVSDMARKVGTEWAVPPISRASVRVLGTTGWDNRCGPVPGVSGRCQMSRRPSSVAPLIHRDSAFCSFF